MSKAGPNDWLSSKDVDIDGNDSPGSSIKMLKVDTTVTLGELSIIDPLGSQAAATSVSTTASTEDVARIGAVNETAPATDTAASGLNGRLQRIAQRLTSLLGPATMTDYSITNMTGSSQSVVGAGNGTHLIFLQAPAGNAGVVWISLAGGTAVVGTGLPLAAGATVTINPGIANAITGIAATANDDLTVYAG